LIPPIIGKFFNINKDIFLSTFVVTFGLLLGRLFGFLREVLIASKFGISSESDIATILLTIPDFLVGLIAGGALSVVLIPEFQKIENIRLKINFLLKSSFILIIALTLICFFLDIFSFNLVFALAPGLEIKSLIIANKYFSIIIWSVPVSALVGITTAYLHSKNEFFIASMSNFFFNISIISCLLFLNVSLLNALLIGIFLGAFTRLISQIIFIKFWKYQLNSLFKFSYNRDIFLNYLKVFSSNIIILIFPIISRALSSKIGGEGYLAAYHFAYKLVEFPLVFTGSVFALVIYPKLSNFKISIAEFRSKTISFGFLTLIISFVLSLFLYFASKQYVEIVYNRGQMDHNSINTILLLFKFLIFSLPFQSMSLFFIAVLNAKKETQLPLYINSISLIIFIPFVLYMAEYYETISVALSFTVIQSFIFLLLVISTLKLLYFNKIKD